MTVRYLKRKIGSLGLRLAHLIVMFAVAMATLIASRTEWEQLARSQRQMYHNGAPPRPLLIAASLVAGIAAVVLLTLFLMKRSAPISFSVAILTAAFTCFAFGPARPLRESRRWEAANLEMLGVGRDVAQQILEKDTGSLAIVDGIKPLGTSPVRRRTFQAIPYRINLSQEGGAQPATIVVSELPAQKTVQIVVVGLTPEGQASLIKDALGKAIVYEVPMRPTDSGRVNASARRTRRKD